jgi:hypothetical protein
MKKLDPESLRYQEHDFTGYSLAKANEAYNDEQNLVPMCSKCNAEKNGPRDRDHSDPTEHDADCKSCANWWRDHSKGPDDPGAGLGGGPDAMVV